jgi:hypothetical protein
MIELSQGQPHCFIQSLVVNVGFETLDTATRNAKYRSPQGPGQIPQQKHALSK